MIHSALLCVVRACSAWNSFLKQANIFQVRPVNIHHSTEQRWRKYVFCLQGAYTPTGKLWLYIDKSVSTWRIIMMNGTHEEEKYLLWQPRKGRGSKWIGWSAQNRKSRARVGSWLLDCCWMGGIIRKVMPKTRREVQIGESRNMAWSFSWTQTSLLRPGTCSLKVTKDYTR